MKFSSNKGVSLFKVILLVIIVILIAGVFYYNATREFTYNNPTTKVGTLNKKTKGEKEILEYPEIVKEKKDISSFIKKEKVDNWEYDGEKRNEYSYSTTSSSSFSSVSPASVSGMASDTSGAGSSRFSFSALNDSMSYNAFTDTSDNYLGFSVGGAKDSVSYRENINNDYFPLETDITYEGIYYDYYFDTGKNNSSNDGEMFYPSYSKAISKDPISGEEEYFLSVGLNSNIKESDFARDNLNLVIALDISGSMGAGINNYYYDANYNAEKVEDYNEDYKKTKMQLAEEALNMMLDELKDYDNVGIVLFESTAHKAKKMDLMVNTDIDALKKHILEVGDTGGTNFEDAYRLSTEMITEDELFNVEGFTNRIIVITDAMPNIGETTKEGLKKEMYENAQKGIYTTFVGVGVDFNTEVVKNITDVRGANYHSIAEAEEFKKVLADEFEFMVSPMVYDLDLSLSSDTYEIEAVYGTDSIDSEEGNIMHVNTLFPSRSDDSGDVKGGLIVLQLKKIKNTPNAKMDITVSYETIKGEKKQNSTSVNFENGGKEYYDNTGIRKGIALARYVSTVKDWIAYDRDNKDDFLITEKCGIIPWVVPSLGENERQSVKLKVSDEYKQIFTKLSEYLQSEMNEVGDQTMQQEIDILNKLTK